MVEEENVVAFGHGWLCSLFANRGMQRIVASLLLLTVLASLCPALVSTNVPLDHWSYDAVDKLANYALIDSAMLTTRPISRIEMARHIGQAMHRLKQGEGSARRAAVDPRPAAKGVRG